MGSTTPLLPPAPTHLGPLQAAKSCLLLLLLAVAFLLSSGIDARHQDTRSGAYGALGAAFSSSSSSSSPSSSSPGKRPLPPEDVNQFSFLGYKSATSVSFSTPHSLTHTQPEAELAEEPASRSLWEQTHARSTSADWQQRAVLSPLHDSLVLQGYQFGSKEYAQHRMEMDKARMWSMGRGRMLQQEGQSGNDTVLMKPVLSTPGKNVIEVYLGTPPQPMYVNFDTGSSNLWVACDCTNCTIPPVQPFYRNESSTGQLVNETGCDTLTKAENNVWAWNTTLGVCDFNTSYEDKTAAKGVAVVDLMTIDGVTPQLQNGSVQGYVNFGCATQLISNGHFFAHGRYTGLMGAGPLNDSALGALANQQVLPWVFAICLDSTNGNGSKLVLGRAPTPASLSTVPLEIRTAGGMKNISTNVDASIKLDAGSLVSYFVTVAQISLGGSPVVGTSGATAIFDTGTYSTVLPQAVFDSLKQLVEASLGFSLVYNDSQWCFPSNITLTDIHSPPTITLSFPNGATFDVLPTLYLSFPDKDCFNAYKGDVPFLILGDSWIANQYLLFDVENEKQGWAPMNCSTGEPLTTTSPPPSPTSTPPLPASPAPTSAPPPSPSGGGLASISCSLEASWQQGGQSYWQYTCVLSNSGPDPLLNLSLSCLNFNPTTTWNINPDCTLPTTILWSHQTTSLGYVTTASTPATLTVASYSSPSPAISVSPASLPNSAVTLACASAQAPFVSGTQYVYQFQCTLSNGGQSSVSEVKLSCSNYLPTQSWNIDPQCHLLQPGLYPGQSYDFGFQSNIPNPTFGLASAA